MIKGLATPTPIAPQRESASSKPAASSLSAKKTEKAEFADQLFGAKSGKLESPVSRNERKEVSGRESEGNRSKEREKQDSQSSTETRAAKKAEGKPERKVAAKKDSPKTEPRETERPQTINREPVAAPQDRPVTERPIADNVESSVETTSADGKSSQTVNAKSEAPSKVPGAKGPAAPKADVKMPDLFSSLGGAAMAAPPVVVQDPVVAQTDTTVQMLLGMQTQEAGARQDAMKQFLTQMEDELGVPPEKVLQAFSEMDLDSLAETPQNSVGAFVEGLDLEPKGQVKAAELYKNLLDKRGDAILGEKLASFGEDLKIEVASPRDVRLKELDKSLTELNQSFFRKDGSIQDPEKAQQAVESMDAQIAKLMRERSEKNVKPGKNDDKAVIAAAAGAGALATEDLSDDEMAKLFSDSSDSTFSSMTTSASDTSMPKLPSFGGDQASNDMMGGQGQEQAKSQAAPVAAPKNAEFKDSVTKEMKTVDKKAATVHGEKLETGASAIAGGQGAGQTAAPKAVGAAAAGTAANEMMMGRQPTAGDEQQNIREMVKQANVMLKRGGGEMKIEMTPEGMGKVHLKVAVENGQVSVQMLTESDSAKRLLEKGLGDLRSSLAEHQLKVEHVKVDVGQDIQKHMDQQAGQEQARNFAREFMQQQREERQGMREGAFAMRGLGSYGGNKRAPIAPDTVQGSARASSSGGSSRLNLVA